MKRIIYHIIFITTLCSCQLIDVKDDASDSNKVIASAYNKKLYKKDIVSLFPKGISSNDSIILAKSIIENWGKQQLLLKKAEENSTLENNINVEELVANYRNSLLINNYKERLIQQQLDTIVSEEILEEYYATNKSNFRLNEELVKIKYISFGKNIVNLSEIEDWFKSDDIEDVEMLENQQLTFKTFNLNDSVWTPVDKLLLKLPLSKGKLLKKSKFIKKEDSLSVYLVAVKDIRKRNEIAPLSYVSNTIKQMILHKRKLELIREIEKILIKDAIQSKDFIIH